MTREDAINYIKEIQNGKFDRNTIKGLSKGKIAKYLWNNATFAYGMEYGAILATMKIFDLTLGDLK